MPLKNKIRLSPQPTPPNLLIYAHRRVAAGSAFSVLVVSLLNDKTQKKTNNNIVVTRLINNVPRIGLEPTCREALAPETSVSTISPSGHRFVAQR